MNAFCAIKNVSEEDNGESGILGDKNIAADRVKTRFSLCGFWRAGEGHSALSHSRTNSFVHEE